MSDSEPKWLDTEFILELQKNITEQPGSATGVRDPNLLESALVRPQNSYFYEGNNNLYDLAALYTEGVAKNHAFVDGNKRSAFLSADLFLKENGLALDPKFSDEFIETVEGIADGSKTRADLTDLYERAAIPFSYPDSKNNVEIKADSTDVETKNSTLGRAADTLSGVGKKGGFIAGPIVSGLAATFALVAGSSKVEAAEMFYEGAVPYGETQIDALRGDVEAVQRSATIETASNIGAAGGVLVGAAIGTAILPGVGTAVGAVVGGIGAGIASGEATEFIYDRADDIGDWWDESDDDLLERLPTEMDEAAPPELQHLVEIKRMLTEAQHERAALGTGRTRDQEILAGRRAASDKVERIEEMYDEAYDTYEDNGALEGALTALDQWVDSERIAQEAIGNMQQQEQSVAVSDNRLQASARVP